MCVCVCDVCVVVVGDVCVRVCGVCYVCVCVMCRDLVHLSLENPLPLSHQIDP